MKNRAAQKKEIIHINLPEELYFRLKQKSSRAGESVDQLVHSALWRDLYDSSQKERG